MAQSGYICETGGCACGSGVKTVAMQNSAISCMSSVAPISWAVCVYLHTFKCILIRIMLCLVFQ